MSETQSQTEVVEQTATELEEKLRCTCDDMEMLLADDDGIEVSFDDNAFENRIVAEVQFNSIPAAVQKLMMSRGFVAERIENTDDGFKVTYNKVTNL
jgi:hypothetical protein